MAVLIRALTYATLFVGLVLVYFPAVALRSARVVPPSRSGILQLAGALVTAAGAVVAAWCVLTFAFVGKGTPAPFDPPRCLVVRGPYRYVRNPMYLGAALAVAGAAMFYETWVLLAYAMLFVAVMHLFVIGYEEPTLRRTFGADYDDYCRRTARWRPGLG